MKQLLITPKDVQRANIRIAALRALPWPLLEVKVSTQPFNILCLDPIEHTRQAPYCGDETCPCAEDEREEDRREWESDYWRSV